LLKLAKLPLSSRSQKTVHKRCFLKIKTNSKINSMKNNYFHTTLIILALLSFQFARAQNSCFFQVYWQYTWGLGLDLPFYQVRLLPDGAFQHFLPFSKTSFRTARIEPDGTLGTRKEYTGLISTSTDGVLYTGDRFFRAGFAPNFLTFSEIDATGNVLSTQNYPVPFSDTFDIRYIIQAANGERFMVAKIKNSATGFVLKTDPASVLEWVKTLSWPGTNSNYTDVHSGIIRFDGGFSFLLKVHASPIFPSKYQLVQVESNGDINIPSGLLESYDGKFVALARDGGVCVEPGQLPGGVRKYDRYGTLEWSIVDTTLLKHPAYAFVQTADSNYIILEMLRDFVKFDRNLQEIRRSKSASSGNGMWRASLFELEDKTIFAQGSQGPFGPGGGLCLWALHTDSIGSYNCALVDSPEPMVAEAAPLVFPNPSSSRLNIRWPADLENEKIRVAVYDLQGRVVQQFQESKTADLSTLHLQNLPGGMYLLQWSASNGRGVVKFLIE